MIGFRKPVRVVVDHLKNVETSGKTDLRFSFMANTNGHLGKIECEPFDAANF